MRSHRYEIAWKPVLKTVSLTFGSILLFALSINLWLAYHPDARSAPEPLLLRLMIGHHWVAAGSQTGVDTVLIGDSSCLMGIDAPLLSSRLSNSDATKHKVLNLGAMSFYAMDQFAVFVDRLTNNNQNALKRIVLAVHPEMLRQPEEGGVIREQSLFRPIEREDDSFRETMLFYLGLKVVEQKFVWAHVPISLPNQFGSYYGYQKGLQDYMTLHAGSVVEAAPFQKSREKNVRFRLQDPVIQATKRLRARLPGNIPLDIVIMPIPTSSRAPQFAEDRAHLLAEWVPLLQPCVVLTNLSSVLPDTFFSSHTHLNEKGQQAFTRWLARELNKSK